MWVPFTDAATKISYDGTNFFILDTNLLEPERYYRLLFKVNAGEQQRVLDSQNIFRVTRHGEI